MTFPYLTVDLDKIEQNARTVVALCRQHGIEVTGVTKVVCGSPEVAKAMLAGGVSSVADSRLENIDRLRDAGVDTSYMLLRVPPLSGVEEVVASVDMSLNTELAVLEGLSEAASRHHRTHDVILMVDLGDLREGIWPVDVIPFVREAIKLPGIRIIGLGANLACFAGIVPSTENMSRLVALAREIEQTFAIKLKWISGINSSGLELIASGTMPAGINHARIGEAILLGRETIRRRAWPGTCQDAFVLRAEVLELKRKPSVPVGEQSEDAFGNRPVFKQHGTIDRALLNVGREDIAIEGIAPLDSRLTLLGASSGYLAVDTTRAAGEIRVGDELGFSLNYSALLAAMTSEYVKKRFVRSGASAGDITTGKP